MSLTDEQLQNRVKWVRALLSGEYKQGNGYLKRRSFIADNYTYCCLGVACEVVVPESNNLVVKGIGHAGWYMDPQAELPLFGLSSDDQLTAGKWNDDEKYDFSRIADLIAHATEYDVNFASVNVNRVPEGYATEWLEQFD